MSLNEKYIINGSTLEDIGNALRAKKIIAPFKTASKEVLQCSKKIAKPYGSGTATTTMTDIGDFYFLPYENITKVKIFFTGTITFINQIQDSNGNVLIANASLPTTDPIEVSFPFVVVQTKGYDGGSGSSPTAYLNMIPISPQGEYYDRNNTDLTGWNNSTNYSATFSNLSIKMTNLIPVEDLATNILASDAKVLLLAPFVIGTSSSYGSKSTVLPDGINSMTDIKKLIFIYNTQSSSYTVAKLEPSTAQTTYYSSLGGGLGGSGTAYKMKYATISRSNQVLETWESTIDQSSSTIDIYFEPGSKKLVRLGGSGELTTYVMPAILFY